MADVPVDRTVSDHPRIASLDKPHLTPASSPKDKFRFVQRNLDVLDFSDNVLLTVPIEEKCIAGKTVHSIGAGVLLVCLAEKITTAEVEPLALGIAAWHKELAPAGESQVVFRDSAFADDVAKTNLTAILQQNGLENVRSL